MSEGADLPVITIESEDARALADLVSIKRDLEFVATAAERLAELTSRESVDVVAARALQTAALIAYVRCFASGKRFGLNDDTLSKGPKGAREYHQHLKDMRDKHIAHSVNPFEQAKIGVILSADEKSVEGVV
ncbi:MAG: hypothetical protein M3389_04180, partial [Actinomycetota bacterium]|nr:hypothetical protein [Actinomycetota bacterium]